MWFFRCRTTVHAGLQARMRFWRIRATSTRARTRWVRIVLLGWRWGHVFRSRFIDGNFHAVRARFHHIFAVIFHRCNWNRWSCWIEIAMHRFSHFTYTRKTVATKLTKIVIPFIPFDRFIVGALLDVSFSLLTVWPADDEAEEGIFVGSVVTDCAGVDSVGVFGGDSSFTCRADFNLSMTALSEPFRFLFGWLLPDDFIESWLDDDASIKLSIGMNGVDIFV